MKYPSSAVRNFQNQEPEIFSPASETMKSIAINRIVESQSKINDKHATKPLTFHGGMCMFLNCTQM